MKDTLDRQLVGITSTLSLTAVIFAYLLLCALPPFVWSRRSYYHPIWRGVESFVCYVIVAALLGAILAAAEDGESSLMSGLALEGGAWAGMLSVIVLLLVFLGASWWGGRSAARHRQKARSRKRR